MKVNHINPLFFIQALLNRLGYNYEVKDGAIVTPSLSFTLQRSSKTLINGKEYTNEEIFKTITKGRKIDKNKLIDTIEEDCKILRYNHTATAYYSSLDLSTFLGLLRLVACKQDNYTYNYLTVAREAKSAPIHYLKWSKDMPCATNLQQIDILAAIPGNNAVNTISVTPLLFNANQDLCDYVLANEKMHLSKYKSLEKLTSSSPCTIPIGLDKLLFAKLLLKELSKDRQLFITETFSPLHINENTIEFNDEYLRMHVDHELARLLIYSITGEISSDITNLDNNDKCIVFMFFHMLKLSIKINDISIPSFEEFETITTKYWQLLSPILKEIDITRWHQMH